MDTTKFSKAVQALEEMMRARAAYTKADRVYCEAYKELYTQFDENPGLLDAYMEKTSKVADKIHAELSK